MMYLKTGLLLLLSLSFSALGLAQEVPILDYAVDLNGQVQLTVAATSDHYYVLHVRHQTSGQFDQATAMVLGNNGSITLSEPLAAYPLDHYQVTEHWITAPADTDQDGLDDLQEYYDQEANSPFNSAQAIDFQHGVTFIPDRATFKKLSYQTQQAGSNASEELKFFIHNREAEEPELYFINSNTHTQHTPFAHAIGYTNDGTLMTGTIAFHPYVQGPNGTLGTYRFFFQPNNTFSLAYVQKAMELLAANLPFLKNNLCYYPLEPVGLSLYLDEAAAYAASRVCVLFESDLYAELDYLALNVAEGYGQLRAMGPQETPQARDIVLYESLPNEMPRVGGMITTVMQTPLSHVNLRAIQDQVPNAFIRHALQNPEIQALVGKYVYYKADRLNFTIREASLAEVDAFYASIRPKEGQAPIRDLAQTKIKSLDSIAFTASASFGVKCANLATMRHFGFPDGTIPEGYGIPFYFYDAFMEYNGLYVQAKDMLSDSIFQSDYTVQIQRLKDFRSRIKAADMPSWMLDALTDLQNSFPAGTSIRCRSSTNNEDLPGFSGAGLYDSYTHHPDEGHLSKTIRQVYASLWNFRAFDERAFYRVDHFKTAMGVLVHPNYENEQANGVGVSTDPIYQTAGTYYLNTQIGEDLVTNPNLLSIPEEILLDAVSVTEDDYFVINRSNQAPQDTLILKEEYLDQLRAYLNTIHERFQVLYEAEDAPGFAMEIEYKLDASGVLNIKQARPWASFWAKNKAEKPETELKSGLSAYPNPMDAVLYLDCSCETEMYLELYTLLGQKVLGTWVDFRKHQREISVAHLNAGVYFLRGRDKAGGRYFGGRLLKF